MHSREVQRLEADEVGQVCLRLPGHNTDDGVPHLQSLLAILDRLYQVDPEPYHGETDDGNTD